MFKHLSKYPPIQETVAKITIIELEKAFERDCGEMY